MYFNFLFFSILVLVTFNTFSQSNNDPLQKIWQNEKLPDSSRFKALAEFYKNNYQSHPDSTLRVLDYYYTLAKEKKSNYELYNVANDRAGIYRFKGENDLALEFYLEAEELALLLKDSTLQAAISSNIGVVYVQKKEYLKATQYFTNAQHIYKKIKDLKGESHILTSLGSVFLIIQNYDMAFEYYKEALEISKRVSLEPRRIAVIYINMGWTSYERRDLIEAQKYYEKALEILNETQFKYFIVECYATLTRINFEMGNIEKAEYYLLKSQSLYNELSIKKGIIFCKILDAKIRSLTDLDESIQKVESILNELPKDLDKEQRKELYEFLYISYKSKNLHKKSLEMFELFTIYNDSIQLEKNNFAVIREIIKNDFELKLKEAKVESEQHLKNVKDKQTLRLYLILFFSIVMITFISLHYIRKAKQYNLKRIDLLDEISKLKENTPQNLLIEANEFRLVKHKIEASIQRKLNETDWSVLNVLLENPEITNKELSEKVFLSIDGLGSSLRRMYEYFEIKETKYKKIALISSAIKRSSK